MLMASAALHAVENYCKQCAARHRIAAERIDEDQFYYTRQDIDIERERQ